MDDRIQNLIDRRYEAQQQVKLYDEAIQALQLICDHQWVYDGHGHNYDTYVCTQCGRREER